MNKHQRKINKLTKQQISIEIKEIEGMLSKTHIQRQCGKSNLQIYNLYKILNKLQFLNSNNYYRFIRKNVRLNCKNNTYS